MTVVQNSQNALQSNGGKGGLEHQNFPHFMDDIVHSFEIYKSIVVTNLWLK